MSESKFVNILWSAMVALAALTFLIAMTLVVTAATLYLYEHLTTPLPVEYEKVQAK